MENTCESPERWDPFSRLYEIADGAFWAFPVATRKEIGARDHWTCECGRAYKDGWMVEAAHYEGMEGADNPEAGRILCMACHLREHIAMGDMQGAGLIAGRIWQNGFHHWQYQRKNPGTLENDRRFLVAGLETMGIDPRGLIHFEIEFDVEGIPMI